MASTYSALKIQLMATGDNNSTWGDVTNQNFLAFQQAITGSEDIPFAGANIVLPFVDSNALQTARNLRLRATGVMGGATRDLIVPGIPKQYIIRNDTDNFLRVKNAAGVGVTIPAGTTTVVFNNGVDVVEVLTWASSLAVTALTGLGNGSAPAPSLAFLNSPNTGLFLFAPGTLGLTAGGVEGFRLSATLGWLSKSFYQGALPSQQSWINGRCALAAGVGAYTYIGTILPGFFSFNEIIISDNTAAGGTVSKFTIPFSYDDNSANWHEISPNTTNGPRGASNWALDIQGSSGTLRLRNKGANANPAIDFFVRSALAVFTPDGVSAGVGATVTGLFRSGAGISSLPGPAGVGPIAYVPGGALQFPAVQIPSADANTMDDFEIGSFTPTLFIGGVAATQVASIGRYQKVGQVVTITGMIYANNANGGVGPLTIAGLPFPMGNFGSNDPVFLSSDPAGWWFGGLTGTVMGNISANDTSIRLHQVAAGAGPAPLVSLTQASFVVGLLVNFGASYQVYP